MADFFLDFRARTERATDIEDLLYFPELAVDRVDADWFTFFSTRTGPGDVWAPFRGPDRVAVAIAGRVALDADQWESARRIDGEGGVACKAIWEQFSRAGIEGMDCVSGSAIVFIDDPASGECHLMTDLCGAYPCYGAESGDAPLYGSLPDFLADEAGLRGRWDRTSLAEFLVTGRVSSPFSYYTGIRRLGFAELQSFARHDGQVRRTTRPIGNPADFSFSTELSLVEHAERLVAAIRAATVRCSQRALGRTAIALSGGLDSRTLLCHLEPDETVALCAFDEENSEFRIAGRIAREAGIELVPLRRDFDHYGSHSEMAVRMSGGMGDIGSNHFLGFRRRLAELGVGNLITGCYFDYLFKALALDSDLSRLLRRESRTPFRWQFYPPHFGFDTALSDAVGQRLERVFPAELREDRSDLGRSQVAALRTFPLSVESDNAQRLVTQKMVGWSVPAIDAEVIEVYRTTPPELKLDRKLFKAVVGLGAARFHRIPDANTGLPVGAPMPLEAVARYWIALRRQLERGRARMATQESWPNWVHYLSQSQVVDSIWRRPNPQADEILAEITGRARPDRLSVRTDRDCRLALRMLTLKIWLDQREGIAEAN